MKLVYILGAYPTLSETFILRMQEEIIQKNDFELVIISFSSVDYHALEKLSPILWKAYSKGSLKIISISNKISVVTSVKSVFMISTWLTNRVAIKRIIRAVQLLKVLDNEEFQDAILFPQYTTIAVSTCLAKIALKHRNFSLYSCARGADITKLNTLSQSDIDILKTHCTRLLPVSESLKKIAIDKGFLPSKIEVVYSGIDTSGYSKPDLKEKLGDSFGKIQLLQVGRLVEKKGQLMTLKMLSRLKDENYNFHLTLIGDGSERYKIINKVNELNLKEEVTITGSKPYVEVAQAMQQSDFLLVPSLTPKSGDCEGIPNVVKESMLNGCCVIASDHSGTPEVVKHLESGFLFKEGDIESFLNTTMLALDSDIRTINIFRKKGYYQVKEQFDITQVYQRLKNIIKRSQYER